MMRNLATWAVALLVILLPAGSAGAQPAKPSPAGEPVLQAIEVGAQIPFVWERKVRTTWNEGVRAPGEPAQEERTEPRYEEVIKVSADMTDVVLSGDVFRGTWRNTHGTDFYDEFVTVTGELSKDRKRLKWAEIRRQRFDKASIAEPPLDHGLTTQVIRVEDLPDFRSFPRNPPMYTLRPDAGRLDVPQAELRYVHDAYHSREETTDKALGIDKGKTPGGLQKIAAVTLTFRYSNQPLPPPRKVFVEGDWPGLHFVVAALRELPGVDLFDRTALTQHIRRQEIELSKSGLVGSAAVADLGAKNPDVTIRVTRATRDKGDMSAEAVVRTGQGEQTFALDLRAGAYDAFGSEGSAVYLARRIDAFTRGIARAVGPGSEPAMPPAKTAGKSGKGEADDPASVAVISFEDARCIHGQDGADADNATTDLQWYATRGEELVLVERNRLFGVILSELQVGSSELADKDHAPRLGRITGARYLVLGGNLTENKTFPTTTPPAERRRLVKTALRLVDVQTGQVLAADAFEASSYDEQSRRLEAFSNALRSTLPGK